MQTRRPTEKRQAEIVAAALRLARDSSPVLITTGDIAAAIGVTQGAVFKHFPTKEAIWLGALTWVRTHLLKTLGDAAQSQAAAAPKLAAVFHAHVDFVIRHPGVPRVIFHELQQPADSALKQEVRNLLQAYRALLLRIIGAGIESGELASGLHREAAATLFVGIVQGLVMQSMLAGPPGTMKAQADSLFTLYLRGIQEAP